MTRANFSFALLRIDHALLIGRRDQWRDTSNDKAVVLSDRNLADTGGAGARSVHSNDVASGWRGMVAYADNHVVFEVTPTLTSRTNYRPDDDVNPVPVDNLFADDPDAQGRPNADAAMVYQDATTYVNQK